jgi:putative membrane protein
MRITFTIPFAGAVKTGLITALAVFACALHADESQRGGHDKAKKFIEHAAQGNAAEVALAQVAERRAQNAELRQFATQLRQEHTEANKKLEPIAKQHGVQVNQPLDDKHQKKLEKFGKLSGQEFDREYAKEMLRDHKKDIAKYEKAAKEIDDAEVKKYARETLPTLRQHLQHAKQVAQAAGVDQATITAILEETPDAVGGTADDDDDEGKKSGEHEHDPERRNQQQP